MTSDLRFRGANERIRTADLRITSALLYQLSHVGETLLSKRLLSIAKARAWRKRLSGKAQHKVGCGQLRGGRVAGVI